jgi:PHD/YefM family antitoxin component YafN of YafNO toxin-antitoxin module
MESREVEVVKNETGEETDAEKETAYLLSTPANRKRLMEALSRTETIAMEAALERLGI